MLINSLISLGSPATKTFVVPPTTFGGRIRFAGNNYLNSTASFSIGTGTFTIEMFYRMNSGNPGTEQGLFSVGADTTGFAFRQNGAGANGKLNFLTGYGGSYNTFAATSNTPADTTWRHVAVTRDSSGILRIFRDGVQVYQSASAINTNLFGTGVQIGRSYSNINGAYVINGAEIAALRVSNICRYNAAFTPSTVGPYVAGANDLLVANFDSAGTFLNTTGTSGITTLTNNSAVTWVAGFP